MQEYATSQRALVFASHTLHFHYHTTFQNVDGSFNEHPERDTNPKAAFFRCPDIFFQREASQSLVRGS